MNDHLHPIFREALAPFVQPKLHAYQINIGSRSAPRLSFGCMAPSSAVAVQQHIDLAEEGERVEAVPVGREPFPVLAVCNELGSTAAEGSGRNLDMTNERSDGVPAPGQSSEPEVAPRYWPDGIRMIARPCGMCMGLGCRMCNGTGRYEEDGAGVTEVRRG